MSGKTNLGTQDSTMVGNSAGTVFGERNLVVRSKIWLEIDGSPFMGEGRAATLQAIDRHGSVIKASSELNISYRRMRGAIREMEQCIGERLVLTRRGGEAGGSASITDLARELVSSFNSLQEGVHESVNADFGRIYGRFFDGDGQILPIASLTGDEE